MQVDDIIGDEQQSRIVSKLHEILRPFLLRRTKRDVLLKMPPKMEVVVYCGMTGLQVPLNVFLPGRAVLACATIVRLTAWMCVV